MKLIKLSLRNFKGIRSFEQTFDGQSANIYGQNASGKTSVADAVSWLLFDKDTQNRSPAAFGIKTLDENGNPIHGEQHTVEAEFSVEGKALVLKKVYEEKWTKSRGFTEAKLTNHITSHYWNEEPVLKGDYTERIEGIMPERLFKMLTIPSYFPEQMHWKERRDVLTELCGFIDDNDVIAAHPDLKDYPAILDGNSQESTVNILRDRKKKVSKLVDEIPARIDQTQGFITDPEKTEEEAKANIQVLKDNLAGKQDKLSAVKAGGGTSELSIQIQKIESEKQEARNKHRQANEDALSDARAKVADLENKVDESQAELREAIRNYDSANMDFERAEEAQKEIADDMDSASRLQPDPKPEAKPDNCPYCNQTMPHDHDDTDHYEKYLADFNTKKAERLKELKADFQQAEIILDDLHKTVKEKEVEGAKVRARHEQRKQALDKAVAELEALKAEQPEFSSEDFDNKINALNKRISEIRLSKQSEVDRIQSEITEIESHIEDQKKIIREHENNRKYHAAIKDLKEELKRASDTLNDTEKALHTIEAFNRAKAGFITDKINNMFSIVTWRLFRDQTNGGLTEVADPVVNGVPYSEGLNNAARIQAGIDIIKTLSQFYGKKAPVWIDNRESVTTLPDNDLQTISLIVSPEDRVLRVEKSEKIKEVA